MKDYTNRRNTHIMSELEELYFSEKQFKLFLDTVPKLPAFTSEFSKPPMSAYQFQVYYSVIYYTCIRPGAEALRLTRGDFNLEYRILQCQNLKGGYHKTTIPPPLISILKEYFTDFEETQLLFHGHRATFWRYTKEIGKLAGIKYFDEFVKRSIVGLYLYVFKHAYIQRLEDMGCPGSLISIKSRHKPDSMARQTVDYAKSLRGLLIWEQKNITETMSFTKERKNGN